MIYQLRIFTDHPGRVGAHIAFRRGVEALTQRVARHVLGDGDQGVGPRLAAFDEAAWKAPREADIPADSLGVSIKRGLYLLRFTPESLPASWRAVYALNPMVGIIDGFRWSILGGAAARAQGSSGYALTSASQNVGKVQPHAVPLW